MKCKACKQPFTPTQPLQKACGWECALVLAKKLVEQADKVKHREAKARLKTKAQHIKDTQAVVNKYVRLRDKDLRCCACGNDITGQRHASHFRPAGNHSRHRFDPRNIHVCCYSCNVARSGNLIAMRANLIDRIGLDAVEELETDNRPYSWTIEELKAIKAEYKTKLKEARNGLHSCDANPAGGQAGNQTAMEPAPETLPGVRDHS